MTSAGPSARRVTSILVAIASAVALSVGLVVVVIISPRATADIPLSPDLHGLARGVDSSSWQHPHGAHVNWSSAAAAGPSFAFIKATEGTGPANSHYEADVLEARAAGMAVGSYHKARPATDPLVQARAFADRLQTAGGPQLPPVLDIETDEGLRPDELVNWTRTFLEETRHLTGRTPILYTYPHFWNDKTDNSTAFTDYPLWLAEYDTPEPTQPLPGGWSEWLFWQHADNGSVAGFSDDVDLNVFAGTREDLAAWVGPVTPGEVPPPAPEPAPEPEPVPAPEAPLEFAEPEAAAAPEPAPTPAETMTLAVPRDIPVPDGTALPETVTVPAEMLAGRTPEVAARDYIAATLLR